MQLRTLLVFTLLLVSSFVSAAVDSRDKRGSANNSGGPWIDVLPNPNSAITQADRALLSDSYSGFTYADTIVPTVALSTVFLSGAVPSTAVFRAGSAYAASGERYVASCTAPYVYVFGIAHRGDGAMCIDTSGPVYTDKNGYGVTEDGRVVADTCEGEFFTNAIPRSAARAVCMTDIN